MFKRDKEGEKMKYGEWKLGGWLVVMVIKFVEINRVNCVGYWIWSKGLSKGREGNKVFFIMVMYM